MFGTRKSLKKTQIYWAKKMDCPVARDNQILSKFAKNPVLEIRGLNNNMATEKVFKAITQDCRVFYN